MLTTTVEAKALLAKLRKLEGEALAPVRAVVTKAAGEMKAEIEKLISGTGKSRPGRPPSKRTGRMLQSLRIKVVGDGLRQYVTLDAQDKEGRRYPFMVESGTATAPKRPFIKKAQRKVKKTFQRDLVEAVRKVTR